MIDILIAYNVNTRPSELSVRYAKRTAADFILVVPKYILEKNIDELVVVIFASELVWMFWC